MKTGCDLNRPKAGGLDMWLEQWPLQGLAPVAMAPRVRCRLENAHPGCLRCHTCISCFI